MNFASFLVNFSPRVTVDLIENVVYVLNFTFKKFVVKTTILLNETKVLRDALSV